MAITVKKAFEQKRHRHEECHIDRCAYIPMCTLPEIYRRLDVATWGLIWRPTTRMGPDSHI